VCGSDKCRKGKKRKEIKHMNESEQILGVVVEGQRLKR
jgi:hypothetical protein